MQIKDSVENHSSETYLFSCIHSSVTCGYRKGSDTVYDICLQPPGSAKMSYLRTYRTAFRMNAAHARCWHVAKCAAGWRSTGAMVVFHANSCYFIADVLRWIYIPEVNQGQLDLMLLFVQSAQIEVCYVRFISLDDYLCAVCDDIPHLLSFLHTPPQCFPGNSQ